MPRRLPCKGPTSAAFETPMDCGHSQHVCQDTTCPARISEGPVQGHGVNSDLTRILWSLLSEVIRHS
jgi:hypothetical protein